MILILEPLRQWYVVLAWLWPCSHVLPTIFSVQSNDLLFYRVFQRSRSVIAMDPAFNLSYEYFTWKSERSQICFVDRTRNVAEAAFRARWSTGDRVSETPARRVQTKRRAFGSWFADSKRLRGGSENQRHAANWWSSYVRVAFLYTYIPTSLESQVASSFLTNVFAGHSAHNTEQSQKRMSVDVGHVCGSFGL